MPFPTSFLRAYLVPTLLLFALPILALWFFSHAESVYDANYREAAFQSIAADTEISATEREAARHFYEDNPFSTLCTQPTELSEGQREICSDYSQFSIFKKASFAALGLGIVSLLLILGCAAVSFVSRPLQSMSFRIGWNFLRFSAALQTALQGLLAVALSFWMTAVWFERYYVKLILLVGFVALFAIFLAVKAIFAKVDPPFIVDGEPLRESTAPELWRHVREVCSTLETEPPDHIIGGIDDNFFVTEGKVYAQGVRLEGRILFISLSLLRNLTRSQADAILAHEMAHFSGGDTTYSRQLAPSLTHYAHYVGSLEEAGPVAWPAMYLMILYRALFELSLSKTSREREFRADRIAAEQTSPEDVASSLLKVSAYSHYRNVVEAKLFERNEAGGDLAISTRVVVGFTSYAEERGAHEISNARVPHPFDSHPLLDQRTEALKVVISPEKSKAILLDKPPDTWFETIDGASDVEQRLWDAYEAQFAKAHELALAYRYVPSTEAEIELVTKHFPLQTFEGSKDGPIQVSYFGLRLDGSDEVIPFSHIRSASNEERMFKKYLDLKLFKDEAGKSKLSICLDGLRTGDEPFLSAFGKYWGRHQTMAAYQAAPSEDE